MNSKAMETLDLHANSLLATVFSHPSEVLADALLSSDQKRCVLAAWASDAFAVEDRPWLREVPGSSEPIPLADILSALRHLDDDDDPPPRRGGRAIPIRLEQPDIPGRIQPMRLNGVGETTWPSRSASIAA